MNLYLLKYNNYYNRIVKKEDNLSGYLPYSLGNIIQNVNFIPGDNVLTTQIVNWDGKDPDYVLVTTNEGNINSRWFVLETVRTRKGQLQLTLHRDLMVDYYDNIIQAPCFIEKATIQNIADPAIFNKEDMTYNQIKKAQYELRDGSRTAWIVGYIPRDSFNTDTKVEVDYNYGGITPNEIVDNLDDYDYYNYTQFGNLEFTSDVSDLRYGIETYAQFDTNDALTPKRYEDFSIFISKQGTYAGITKGERQGTYAYIGNRTYKYIGNDRLFLGSAGTDEDYVGIDGNGLVVNFTSSVMTEINDAVLTLFPEAHTPNDFKDFLEEEGRIIKNNADGQLYRVHIRQITNADGTPVTISRKINILSGTPYNKLYDSLNNTGRFEGNTSYQQTFRAYGSTTGYKIDLQLLTSTATVTMPATSERYHLIDAPYDMFCIPYPKEGQALSIYKGPDIHILKVDRDAGINIASFLASKFGKDNIYDLQLLPYCPLRQIIVGGRWIDISNVSYENITVQGKDAQGNPIGTPEIKSVMLWCLNSKFSFDIPFKINSATTVLDKKVASETEMWRLCSPNYSGLFEFDLQKNNGISSVNVDCTYKPFNPYIHMNPNFGGLYGYDWDDSRGLICGGDFSLPIVTDAWADYQLQNKNYQQMFDRQIQNMDVNNAVQREREAWQVASGAIGAGVQGAATGMMVAGPYGALAGLGTGALSIAGGIRDTQLNEQLRQEALDYTKDQFGYQLGNIKALPQGLAKVSAFTNNNKIFPFIEQYQCTETEKEALKNKLKYNGMTVMRIGTIQEFINPAEKNYTKGKLIRLEGISEDYHIINAIANEINKGVFI